jgi:hypothetical protein
MSTRSILSASVLTGPEASVRCAGYEDDAPILVLEEPGMHLTVANRDRWHITCADAAFAERLAQEAARFAAETARYHADNYAGPCTCAERQASSQPGASTGASA